MTRKRIAIAGAGVLLASLALVGLYRWAQSTSAGPHDPILAFNSPGCVIPCVLGITPGQTDYEAAANILRMKKPVQGATVNDDFQILDAQGNVYHVAVTRADPRTGSYVSSVEVWADLPNRVTTLGALIDRYGNPSRVYRGRVAGPDSIRLLAVFSGGEILAVVEGTTAIQADSPIISLDVSAPSDSQWTFDRLQVQSHFEAQIRWVGYTSIEDYWSLPAN